MNGLFIAEHLDQNYMVYCGGVVICFLGKYLYIQVPSAMPVVFFVSVCFVFDKFLHYLAPPPPKYKLGQTQGSKYFFLSLRFDNLRGKSSFIIFAF